MLCVSCQSDVEIDELGNMECEGCGIILKRNACDDAFVDYELLAAIDEVDPSGGYEEDWEDEPDAREDDSQFEYDEIYR